MFCFPLIKLGEVGVPVSVTVNLEVVMRPALSVSLPLLHHTIVSENHD